MIQTLRSILRAGRQAETLEAFLNTLSQVLLDMQPGAHRVTTLVRPDLSARLIHQHPRGQGAPSLTAWRWIARDGTPQVLDLVDGQRLGSKEVLPEDFGSRDIFLDGGVKSLIAVPILNPKGDVCGMVTIELDIAARSITSTAELELCVDVAAPWLLELPTAQPTAVKGDPLLPVIGPELQPVVHRARAFSGLDAPLLIRGETGSGKSMLARWVHQQSPRKEGPFDSVNLQAIPADLMEAQLFGSVRGAFTGAQDRKGILETTKGGTLFIDEIDKLNRAGQASLLTLLDDGTYRRVGEATRRHASVRFLFGTNADLEDLIHTGGFLPDLYYRINVLPVRLPPLRARRGEIADWADMMIAKVTDGEVRLDGTAHARLRKENWPGNLRGLNSVMTRTGALARAAGRRVCSAADIEEALGLDSPSDTGWLDQVEKAASTVADSLQSHNQLGRLLQGAFEARVLLLAEARYGRQTALEMFGKQGYLKDNSAKPFRRALQTWNALLRDG